MFKRKMENLCPMFKRRKLNDQIVNSNGENSDKDEAALNLNENNNDNNNGNVTSPSADDNLLKNQLRQFDVLDEVQGDGSSSEYGGDGSEYATSETDLDDEFIEQMLDENLPDDLKEKRKDAQYDEKYKIVLEERGHNHFDVLPEGWVQVTHNSGMPLYLHKQARVCTTSRPYFLGPGSVRKHEIPLSAIPCLNYKRALEKEGLLKTEEEDQLQLAQQKINIDTEDLKKVDEDHTSNNDTNSNNSNNCNSTEESVQQNGKTTNDADVQIKNDDKLAAAPPFNLLANAKIETVKENIKAQSLSPDQITEYCKKLFLFKQIRVMRFKSWSARRKFTKNKKHIRNLQRPTLPDGTKLITFPVISTNNDNPNSSRQKREWIMNPSGKSYVCILHEYVQYALKKQPSYEFKELENAATPYSATVSINNLKYGTGFGTSKKQAKSEAARITLEILIPEMRTKISNEISANGNRKDVCKDLSVFDEIRIEDPRVAEFCAKTTEPSPHAILLTCLQRNFGLGDIKIDYQVNTMKHKRNEFTMIVGKHTATVICKNKRDGKQRASQAILQILHPHIKTWGSLLRLYGNQSVKSFKEKKQEEQEITVLQSKAAINQPNYAILDKLKSEMKKIMESQEATKPIGIFVPPVDVDLPHGSGSNLNNVEL